MAKNRVNDAAVLLPAAGAAVGLGFGASAEPLAGAGILGLAVLFVLPWVALFFVLNMFAMIQSPSLGPLSGVDILGYRFSPAHFILVPFAIRAYLITRSDLRNRWRAPEWFLVAFAVIQPVITFFHAPSFKSSLGALGLTALGILAYLAVYAAVCTPRRLLVTAKIFLWLILSNAMFGILAMGAHLVIHTGIGVSEQGTYGSGVYGLSFEHDIFASTCAVGAIAFFVLWRERNRFFTARFSGIAFWICAGGMLLGLARGAWLGFGLAFVGVLLLLRGGGRRIRGLERVGLMLILLTLLGIAAAAVISSSDTVQTAVQGVEQKASDLVNLSTGTSRARIGETNEALDDWKKSKLVGLGTGTYNQRHPLLDQTNYIGDLYLRALYETGVLGLLLLLGFLVLVFWPNGSLMRSAGELAPLARALTFGGAVITVAYAATDATLQVWPWILLALVRAARVLADREYRAARASRAPALPTATVAPLTVEGNGQTRLPLPVPPRL